jgi:hypothetical protein
VSVRTEVRRRSRRPSDGKKETVLERLRGFVNFVWHTRRLSGVTLVTVDRWTLAEELWSFGEDELYLTPLEMSDEQLVAVWKLAGELYVTDEARSAGEAGASAAVALAEGKRRPLARARRRPQAGRPRFERTTEERLADVGRIEESESYPEAWR